MTDLIHVSNTDLSDYYKDAFGFRPRHYKEWWTKEELEAEYEYLFRTIKSEMEAEAKAEKQALKVFKDLIKKTISYGAGNRLNALKWLVDGEDLEWNEIDLQYFFWSHGLSFKLQNIWSKALTS